MHTAYKKKKRIISCIRTKRLYKIYQIDLVEIATERNNNKFDIFLKRVDHFQNIFEQYQSETKK